MTSFAALSARPGKFLRNERGAVTIEFVVTLPLFLAALAFAFEFGQIFVAHQSTVHNVRAASRYLARTDAGDADVDRARNIVRTGQLVGGITPDYLETADLDVEFERSIDPADPQRPTIRIWRIRAEVDYQPVLFGFIGGGSITIPFVVREEFRIVGF